MDKKAHSLRLNIYLLGQPRIMVGNKPVLTELTTKALVLILYLAANGEKAYSREVLSDMLWPEIPMENSKSNLRQVLSNIKKAWGMEFGMEDSIIAVDKGTCKLNCNMDMFVDLPTFYKGVREGLKAKGAELLQESIDLYQGSFLEGFYVKGSVAVDEWILVERESVSRALRESCKALATLYEEREEFEKALNCLNKLIKTDVLQEDVYRDLMNIHYKNGNRNQAVALYNQCTKLLRKELNISPMEETKKLYMQIVGDGKNQDEEGMAGKASQRLKGILSFKNNFLVHRNYQKEVIQKLVTRGCITKEITLRANPFGGVPYEGFYSLVEELLESKVVTASDLENFMGGFFSEPTKATRVGEGTENRELAFADTLFAFRWLLENVAEKATGLLITIVEYERLDEKTKKLICYLLGNVKTQQLYMLISYSDEEQIQELQKGFKQILCIF